MNNISDFHWSKSFNFVVSGNEAISITAKENNRFWFEAESYKEYTREELIAIRDGLTELLKATE